MILKPNRGYERLIRVMRAGRKDLVAMVELVAILIGIFSIGIFAAHAFDAYHAR
jgi:hypothetical protein